MKLQDWLEKTGTTLERLAARCGFDTSSAGRYALGQRIPRRPHARAIYRFTHGAVQPNDFYDLPRLPRRRPVS